MLIVKFLMLVVSVLLGYFLGYFFTETKYNLSQFDVFKFKAFECRPCLSFHIAWVISTVFSLIFPDMYMLIIGIIFAFALFIGLKVDQKQKTVKADDIEIITEGDEIKIVRK